MTHALERQQNGTARVIPIILRHVEFEGAPFSHLQALPTGAIPVTDRKWRNHDEAFSIVAQGIKQVVRELISEQWLDEGNIHFYREQYEDALKAFKQAIFSNPANALAYIGQGQTLLQLAAHPVEPFVDLDTYYQEALVAFERAISLEETNTHAYTGKGKALLALLPLAEVEDILKACSQAMRLDPKNADAYIVQGDAYMYLDRYSDAITAYEKAIEVAIFFNRYACNKKGDALYELERYEEALTAYNRSIQEFPRHAYAYKGKGDVLYKLGRYSDALTAYEQALSLDYSSPALVYAQKGKVLHCLEHYQEALAAYEQAIQLGRYLANSVRAEAYRGKGNVLQSLSQNAFKKADELEPDRDPFLPDYPDDIP
jgi:superkiller protein 3